MFQTIEGFYRAARRFPYLEQLIVVFPFYAILMASGVISSPYTLVLVFPFVGIMAAGAFYNTICDASMDPQEKNPITRGLISEKTTRNGMLLAIIISIVLFILFYKNYIAFLIFLFYIFLWLAYSGLKIRFKESYFGPIGASFIGYTAAPLVLLVEFNYFNAPTILLLVGLYLVYLAHEIKHTVVDFDEDKDADCKTFAVRINNKRNSTLMEYLLLIVGFILFLESSYLIGLLSLFNTIFIVLFSVSMFFTIFYGLKTKFNINEVIFTAIPYISTKVFLIVFACVVLNLPALLILFIVWIMFMDKYL